MRRKGGGSGRIIMSDMEGMLGLFEVSFLFVWRPNCRI